MISSPPSIKWPWLRDEGIWSSKEPWGWRSSSSKVHGLGALGFLHETPQNVRKISSLFSSAWISPPALLGTPGEDSQVPVGTSRLGQGDGASLGNPACGFHFPPAPEERKGSPEDLWAPCSSCRFINSLSQVLGTWGPWGNAGSKQPWVPPRLPSPRV